MKLSLGIGIWCLQDNKMRKIIEIHIEYNILLRVILKKKSNII